MEKIKLDISTFIYNSITYDGLRFGFRKKDNEMEMNYNFFLNTIIINYYKIYKEAKNNYYIVFKNDSSFFIDSIVNYPFKNELSFEPLKKSITIRITKDSYETFVDIERNELKNISMTNFIRMLLSQYVSLKIYEREKIVFSKKYEIIIEAIKRKRKVFIETKQSKFYFDCYKMIQSPDDEHNYLIGKFYYENDSKIGSIKLSTIYSIVILEESISLSYEDIININEAASKDTRFIGQLVNAKIKFTDAGLRMFEKCYNDRPLYVSIDKENSILEFKNTIDHLFIYLKQFGRHAFVICPIELRNRLKDFYQKATKKYEEDKG